MVGAVIQTREWSILANCHSYYSNSNDTIFLETMATEDIACLLNEGATAVSNPSLRYFHKKL